MFVLAFLALGFLVGNLAGLSSSPVVNTLTGSLILFSGGSAIAFSHKIPKSELNRVSTCIFCICISCLAGVHCGIYEKFHSEKIFGAQAGKSQPVILMAGSLAEIDIINNAHKNKLMDGEEAYNKLYEIVKRSNHEEK